MSEALDLDDPEQHGEYGEPGYTEQMNKHLRMTFPVPGSRRPLQPEPPS
jgi:hypothetical protein